MLSAIKAGSYRIRTLGRMMVKFSLHPMLSKIFLDDLESDYLYELCIIAAMSHCALGIFRINPDIEEQSKNNIQKVQLACDHGDLISYLRIYIEFTRCENKKKWCKRKGIALKNMENVVSLLKEINASLIPFLSEEKIEKIMSPKERKDLFEDPEITKNLLKAISKGLFLNILVKTSQTSEKMGYVALRTNEHVFIHPSSVFVGQNNTPEYLVATGIHKTSKVFATGLSLTEKRWISSILKEIPEDVRPYEARDLLKQQRKSIKINNIPDAVFRRLKVKDLLEEMKQTYQIKNDIDYILKEISILAEEKQEGLEVERLIRDEIGKIRKQLLKKKSRELEYEGGTRVILRNGGYVEEFLFRNQYRTLQFKDLPIGVNVKTLAEQIKPFCVPELINSLLKAEKNFEIIKFEKESNAEIPYISGFWTLPHVIDQDCFKKIKEAETTLRKIYIQNSNLNISGGNALISSFENTSLIATLYYSSFSGDGKVIFLHRNANNNDVMKLNSYFNINGVISKKNPNQYNFRGNQRIRNMNPSKLSEFNKALSNQLEINEKDFKLVAYSTENLHPNFDLEPEYIKTILTSIFSKYVSEKGNLTLTQAILPEQIKAIKPNSKKFYINFFSTHSAKNAFKNENWKVYEELCPNEIKLQLSFMMYFLIESDKFDALNQELLGLKSKIAEVNGPEIEFQKKKSIFKISVKSENREDILACMRNLRKIIKEGTIYPPIDREYATREFGFWNQESITRFLFKHKNLLKDLFEKENQVFIDFNKRITLFGSPINLEETLKDLDDFISNQDCKQEKFLLKSINISALLKCQEFLDLQLCEDLVIIFDQIRKELNVISLNLNYFQQIKILISQPCFQIERADEFFCPKCFAQLKNKYVLLCEHTSCKSCLIDHIESFLKNKESFPILTPCCSIEIPIIDLMELVSGELKNKLVSASTDFYITSNRDEFFKCPSKECNQIFSVKMLELIDYCDICFREIKKEDLSIKNKVNVQEIIDWREEEKEVNEWEQFKECKTCGAIWQKVGGSDHMICSQCDSHFCYNCEKVLIKRKQIISKEEKNIISQHLKSCNER